MLIRTIAAGLIVLVGACSPTSEPVAEDVPAAGGTACPESGEPMPAAKLYIEHNATDADTGVHGLFGGDGWKLFCIHDPSGELLLAVEPDGPLGELGLADIFFESREPTNDAYPLDQLFERFPEGSYTASGVDVEGVTWVGSARLTHAIPAAPVITSPTLSEDEEEIDTTVEAGYLTVSWDAVIESFDSSDIEITGYEVIITSLEDEDPNGWSVPVFDIHVPPTTTSVVVPDGFLATGTSYELEVLALESSGNQTISLGFFTAH